LRLSGFQDASGLTLKRNFCVTENDFVACQHGLPDLAGRPVDLGFESFRPAVIPVITTVAGMERIVHCHLLHLIILKHEDSVHKTPIRFSSRLPTSLRRSLGTPFRNQKTPLFGRCQDVTLRGALYQPCVPGGQRQLIDFCLFAFKTMT
jgi:hypothetical protein